MLVWLASSPDRRLANTPREVVLTREQPVAAFEVRLCLSADAPPEVEGSGSLSGNARLNEGTAELTLENLDVDPDYASPDAQSPPTSTETLESEMASMGVVLTFAAMLILFNLVVDVLYRWVDPRISL